MYGGERLLPFGALVKQFDGTGKLRRMSSWIVGTSRYIIPKAMTSLLHVGQTLPPPVTHQCGETLAEKQNCRRFWNWLLRSCPNRRGDIRD
jgi:hypothetical protein